MADSAVPVVDLVALLYKVPFSVNQGFVRVLADVFFCKNKTLQIYKPCNHEKISKIPRVEKLGRQAQKEIKVGNRGGCLQLRDLCCPIPMAGSDPECVPGQC